MNQQTIFNGRTVGHNANGNVSNYATASSIVYDAQNRLTSVINNGVTSTFKYDGLNRKISQTITGVTTYNVWDGWNLIEERNTSNTLLNTYLYGAGEIIERITGTTKRFYFQDGLGSTSHFSEEVGTLLESYKYNTFGQQTVYDPAGAVRPSGSTYDIRHLFTGQLWMPQAGLYDYRNRVYSPSLTRFLQPDPIGFAGGDVNLYRYCGNDPVNNTDPFGLHSWDNPPDFPPFSQEHFHAAEGYLIDLSGAALGARYYFQQRGNNIGALYALGASGLFALGADIAHFLATLTPPHHQTLPQPPNNQAPAEKKNDEEPKEKSRPTSVRGGGGGSEGISSGTPNSGSPYSGAPPSVTLYVTGIANTQIGSSVYNNFIANNPGAITVSGAIPGVPANTAFSGTVSQTGGGGSQHKKIYKKK